MTPDRVVARLDERLSVRPGETLAWDPAGDDPPNAGWLLLVLRWLAARVPADLAGSTARPEASSSMQLAIVAYLKTLSDTHTPKQPKPYH